MFGGTNIFPSHTLRILSLKTPKADDYTNTYLTVSIKVTASSKIQDKHTRNCKN